MKAIARCILMLCFLEAASTGFAQETAGIGIALSDQGSELRVLAILPDSPAAASKAIQVGDRILAVAEAGKPAVEVTDMEIEEVVALVRGPAGTELRLTLLSRGKKPEEAYVVSLTRGELPELARWGDGVPLAAGTQAPNIEMKRLSDGRSVRLADYQGKIVVLEFWATWCAPCHQRISEYQTYFDSHPEWKDRVVLLTVSIDDHWVTAADRAKEQKWMGTENVWVTNDALKAFHVASLSTTCILDRQGRIVSAEPDEEIPAIVDRLLKQ